MEPFDWVKYSVSVLLEGLGVQASYSIIFVQVQYFVSSISSIDLEVRGAIINKSFFDVSL